MSAVTSTPIDPHLLQRLIPVLDRIRKLAMRRGTGGLKDLARALGLVNEGQVLKCNPDDFRQTLKNFGVVLSTLEFSLLSLGFKDAVGYVQVHLFVEHLFGVLNPHRRELVDLAFDKLDINGNGVLEIDDLRANIDVSKHRDVVEGKKSEDEVLREFLDVFTSSKEGRVTRQDFRAYYAAISPNVQEDALFDMMIRQAWRAAFGAPAKVQQSKAIPSPTTRALDDEAAMMDSPRRSTSPAASDMTVPKRIAGYTGHIAFAQERYGQTFHSIESSTPELAKKPHTWVVGSYVDHTNAFVRKGNKANAHNFKFA